MRPGASGTATVLFTDLVGSTDLMTEIGEAAFDDLRRSHFAALRRTIDGHGGRLVKNTGDGVMAVFGSVVDAIRCAVDMQRATARQSGTRRPPMTIRVGLSVGEVTFEEDDVFGSPVVEAARLVAVAGSGQIVTTAIVRTLAAGRAEVTFADLGALALKGLPQPVEACEVCWEPAPELPTPTLRIYLAGRVRVENGGQLLDEQSLPGRQGRLVFAYLVLERRQPTSRPQLAELLWPNEPPPAWETGLSAVVSKLRSALNRVGLDGADILRSGLGCHQLQLPGDTWVDVEAAYDGLHRAEVAQRSGNLREAHGWAELPAHIANRPFLPGEDAPWIDNVRSHLREMRIRALHCHAVTWAAGDDTDLAIRAAEQAIELDPFREVSWQHLMRASFSLGNRAEALRAYERLRKLLAEEMGINPSPQTEAVYLEILRSS
jgi:class 3 adenylate cyclase/DNA-binding SARP family transcriptional activator